MWFLDLKLCTKNAECAYCVSDSLADRNTMQGRVVLSRRSNSDQPGGQTSKQKVRSRNTVMYAWRRYLQEPQLYPFSHGLSYTSFEYRSLALSASHNIVGDPNAFTVQVEVHNTGTFVTWHFWLCLAVRLPSRLRFSQRIGRSVHTCICLCYCCACICTYMQMHMHMTMLLLLLLH